MANPETFIKSLYDMYADQIYRFLYWQTGDELLAEDLTSEVFYRAWKHYGSLEDSNYRAWLYRVARNLVTDHHRKKKPLQLDEDYDPVMEYDLHAEVESNERIRKVRIIIEKLSPQYRSVIILRFFEQLSCKEVADIMNKTEGNVRILQYRALKELKTKLGHML